ncbi:hypothetical protein HUE56_14950 [Azospirillum oryzae]|uniref:Uncharacterized protein n=1 Tax=Azospirillum oryzae TaxID=286727 RepID=A0A6N1AJR5_9PROT|nr:hypothetical protein [Azospirillum oryzae]KAA0589913.1 hypothetical protein FZ938_09955 [Azospirillum oryzae]QKS51750.1 hypothetical protein HUE56_14950 [Azospirillum oryzae]GLR79540.1 hypothetical protein GCM10007856_22150 [Azospirillum oryzae]
MFDEVIHVVGELRVLSALGLLGLSFILPLTIFIGRSNIKNVRQKIIADLESVFRIEGQDHDQLIPSFEFAAYKYRALPQGPDNTQPSEWRAYFFPVLVFIMVSFSGFLTSSGMLLGKDRLDHFQPLFSGMTLYGVDGVTPMDLVHYQLQTVAVLSFAFFGAYVWSIDYLIRRISNYDLSPISFLRVTGHIILACITAVTLHHAYMDMARIVPEGAVGDGVPELLVAFLTGFFPKLGLQTLLSRVPQLQIRRIDPRAQGFIREYPIDMILGIDSAIKFRLAEFEIEDVQNLATANPILLFVETPYGIYETMDWVAQAQLILALDLDQIEALRVINVRTIFDIERFMSRPESRPRLMQALNCPKTDGKGAVLLADRGITLENLESVVQAIGEDLHVQRLRQIWRNIELKLSLDLPQVLRDRALLKAGRMPLRPVPVEDMPDESSGSGLAQAATGPAPIRQPVPAE